MRRVLLGSGLVPEEGDLDWLVENADLATPYAALRFLDYLSTQVRAEGRIALDRLGPILEEFLARTEVFQDFDEQLRRKGLDLPGVGKAVCKILDDMAEAPEALGLLEDQARTRFEMETPGHGDELFSWLLETFPVRREKGQLFFASRLFRHWWRRQLVGAEDSL
jgi:hypothetical protein